MKKDLLVIVGPTASGKTKLAVILAKKISAEIISADSRQIYKYLDIGTAKPTKEEQSDVSHHFIDIITPDIQYNVGEYKKNVELVIDDIIKRGKKVIVVGGTGLYIKAILEGLSESPNSDLNIRKKFEEIANEKGNAFLYEQLKKIDPKQAEKIHPNDLFRIIRALEVFELSGIPISQFHTKKTDNQKYNYKIYGMELNREDLYNRINERVDIMMKNGLLNEIYFLQKKGYNKDSYGLQCIGYQELFACLNKEYSLDKAVELIKRNSRRYAKRQFTWFKHMSAIKWFLINYSSNYESIADEIINDYKEKVKL